MRYFLILFVIAAILTNLESNAQVVSEESMIVKRTTDFVLTGGGESEQWKIATWHLIPQRRDTLNKRETKVKTLYSDKGIYFLFHNEDELITATKNADFDSLWLEDVNEVFLWPDTSTTIYFEYEISPLNYELPILVPNINRKFLGWRPWIYTNDRKVKHLTKVIGGDKKSNSKIRSWTSEFFIPFALLAPLGNVPANPGSIWRANFYRVDYDHNKTASWSWKKVETTFHQFEKFGRMVFE